MNVKLFRYYKWECPYCKINNIADSYLIKVMLTEDEYRHLEHLESWQEIPAHALQYEVEAVPTKVTCEKCHKEFGTSENE